MYNMCVIVSVCTMNVSKPSTQYNRFSKKRLPTNTNGIEHQKKQINGQQTFEISFNKLHMSLAFVYHIEIFFVHTNFRNAFSTWTKKENQNDFPYWSPFSDTSDSQKHFQLNIHISELIFGITILYTRDSIQYNVWNMNTINKFQFSM